MTHQASDNIEVDGHVLELFGEPLREWLEAGIRTAEGATQYPFSSPSTANYRGYVCTWRIHDSRLLLVDLDGVTTNGATATLSTIFPNAEGPIFADWYSGTLKCGRGKIIGRSEGVYLNVYEEELHFKVVAGKIRQTRLKTNKPPRPSHE